MNRLRLLQAILTATLLVSFASSAVQAIVYVKSDSPGPTFDGTSWATAFHKVQQGLDVAASGDEVWVAKGVYLENIDLKLGVGLYGGFIGTEASRDQRDFRANETILDGSDNQDNTVHSPEGATATTILDGFTVRNGRPPASGGGVGCWDSSPTIANNRIIGNRGPMGGGGIMCSGSSAIIVNNYIAANGGSASGGVYCAGGSPTITNNTIVSNNGDGVHCNGDSSPTISNNIIAFNYSGIGAEDGPGVPVAQYNCVFGNTRFDHSIFVTMLDNIYYDPLLVDRGYGNLHIQPGSPCVNKGLNTAPGLPLTDVDGQPRVQETGVDIGADESDGTIWPTGPYAIVRVSRFGADVNDGSSWELAKRTVQAGIDAAAAVGGEVWVATDTYFEMINMPPYVYIYGGFSGIETMRLQRNWTLNRTILDSNAARGSVVTAWRNGYQVSAIDGFTIQGGHNPVTGDGGGINCQSTSPTIANNVITGNSATAIGGGIGCDDSASPTITNNVITGNTAPTGGGIGCGFYDSSPIITNNTIVANTATTAGGGISSASSPKISNNIVAFNSSGICRTNTGTATPALRNNCVYGNTAYNYSGVSAGIGSISADPVFTNQAGGDYHIRPWSPCINIGWNSAPGLPTTDMDGELRLFGGIVDIGADEMNTVFLPLRELKTLADDGPVYIRGAIVTAVFPQFFYVESNDRCAGIRVDKTGHTLTVGMRADISGVAKTSTTSGERYIAADYVVQSAPPLSTGTVDPLGLINQNLGGCNWNYDPLSGVGQIGVKGSIDLNNIGLLVTTAGKVTYSPTGSYFVVHDGSKFTDPSGYRGIRVATLTGMAKPAVGKNVRITGISSIFKSDMDYYPLIRVRSQADIVVFE